MKDVVFRRIRASDLPLLFRVYASTRAEELAQTVWDEPQKDLFLRMQFDAQHRYYQAEFPDARFEVVLEEDREIGRLYVDRRPGEMRVIDIALLPEYRGRGIGTKLLRELTAEAAASGRRVTIHVERFNRAQRLYRRLGFTPVQEEGLYDLMEWVPTAPRTA